MKVIKKIIAFPFIVILEITIFILTFLTITAGALLSLVAFALSVYSVYLIAINHAFKDGLICAVVAAMCTPWGIPAIAGEIINVLENISDKLRGL